MALCIHQIPRVAKVSANQLKLGIPAKVVDAILAAAGEISHRQGDSYPITGPVRANQEQRRTMAAARGA
jgi:hypothetical protein